MTSESRQLIFPCQSPLYVVDENLSTKVIFKSLRCLVMGITINQTRKGVKEGVGIIILIEVDILLFT